MKGLTRFLLSVLTIGLVFLCHPVVAEAQNDIYLKDILSVNQWNDESDANHTAFDTLSFEDSDAIHIDTAIDDTAFQHILQSIPDTTHISTLSIEAEPLTDLHIASGNIDTVILHYPSISSTESAPRIYLEQQLQTQTVKLFGGNVHLALPYALPELWLGDIDLEYLNTDSSFHIGSSLKQNLVIASDVAHIRLLRQTQNADYEYGAESVTNSTEYINYTGDCLLKKDHSIRQVDIYETYYDGIGGDDAAIRKESLENTSSPYHNNTDDVPLLTNGSWNSDVLPLTVIPNWQADYNKRYQIQYVCCGDAGEGQTWKREYYKDSELFFSEILPPDFDSNTIPYESKIIIEGTDSDVVGSPGLTLTGNWKNVLLRSGRTAIHGNVEHLVLEDCVRFHTNAQAELTAVIEGDVAELELISASSRSSLTITGSVAKGSKSAIVQSLNTWKYAYFSKENGLHNEVLSHGSMNPDIYLYDNENKTGIPYQMNTDQMEAASCAGIADPNAPVDRFNQEAYVSLGQTLTETNLSSQEVSDIQTEAFRGIYRDLAVTDTVFDLTLQLYYGDKNHAYSDGSDFQREVSVTETTAPLTFTILIPGYIEGDTYHILRMHPDNATGRMRYDILPCEQTDNKLTFATDKFSKFVVVEGEIGGLESEPTPIPIPTMTPVPKPMPPSVLSPAPPMSTSLPIISQAPQTSDCNHITIYLWMLAGGLILLKNYLTANRLLSKIKNRIMLIGREETDTKR